MKNLLHSLNGHRVKLWLRLCVFVSAMLWLALRPDRWGITLRYPFAFLRWYHLLWALGMLEMAITFSPRIAPGTSCGRVYPRHYIPAHYEKSQFTHESTGANRRIRGVCLLWALCVAALGSALSFRLIERAHVVIAAIACSLLDQVFVNVWCPLREWFMKNKCCTTCRIYSWGFAMMFSPLLFIPSFWTYSLLAVSAVILVRWEIVYARHPERFFEVSNKALRCSRCENPCRRVVTKVKHTPAPLDIPRERTGVVD